MQNDMEGHLSFHIQTKMMQGVMLRVEKNQEEFQQHLTVFLDRRFKHLLYGNYLHK